MDWCRKKWVNLKAHTIYGRLNRWRYFAWGIGYNFLLFVPALVISILAMTISWSIAFLAIPLWIGENVIYILLIIGRLHDLGFSGWYVAGLYILSYAGALFGEALSVIWGIACFAMVLFLLFKRGTVGPNRFGTDPVDEE